MASFSLFTVHFSLNTRSFLVAALLSFCLLSSGAYSVFRHYDFSYSEDANSYVSMAKGDFVHTSITHRYRVLLPLAVKVCNAPFGSFVAPDGEPIKPASDGAGIHADERGRDVGIRLWFLVFNLCLMSCFGGVLYLIARQVGATAGASLVALGILLTTRWAIDDAALPLVESLYLLVLAVGIYAVMSRNAGLWVAAVLVGPWAKEAFVFVAPVLFAYAPLPKRYAALWFALSGVLVAAMRYAVDTHTHTEVTAEAYNFYRHFYNLADTARLLLHPKGWAETASAVGLGGVILFAVLIFGGKIAQRNIVAQVPALLWWFLGACVAQAAIGEWGRMLFYAAPTYIALFALVLSKHPRIEMVKKWLAAA